MKFNVGKVGINLGGGMGYF